MSRLLAPVYVASIVIIISEAIMFNESDETTTKSERISTRSVSVSPSARRGDLAAALFTEPSPLFFLHLLKHKQKIQRIEKISTTTPTADCICVPYYLCDVNQTIITDGIGTIDVRYRRCTGDLEVCCYLPKITMAPIVTPTATTKPTTPTTKPTTPTTIPTTPTTKPTTPTTTPTTPTTTPTTPTTPPTTSTPPVIFPTGQPTSAPNINCICVATWQCDPNGVIGSSGEGVINPRQQYALCPSVDQVCCLLSSIIDYPTNPPITAPPIVSPTLPPGQTQICIVCGNTIQCTNGIFVPGGYGVGNPRYTFAGQQVCSSPTFQCCPAANSIDGTVVSTVFGPLKNPGTPQACYCVKTWMCTEGNVVNLDGIGAIDPRFVACKSADEVCCRPDGIDVQTLREFMSGQGAYIVNGGGSAAQVACGVRNTTYAPAQPYPVDSGKTYFAEFPWMVALLTQQSNGQHLFRCGATMISTKAVLTAAHCVVNQENGKLVARFGQWDLENAKEPVKYQEATVKTILVHPLYYSGALYHDVAVLILETPVTNSINVSPICLPEQGSIFLAGTRCVGTGWGRNSFGTDGKYQAELRKVDLPIVDRSDCQTRLRSTRLGQRFQLHGSFICAGGELNRDTCAGDGGGPLACTTATGQFIQAGIVSWGVGCGMSNIPAVYTSVSQHRLWIDQQLANYGA